MSVNTTDPMIGRLIDGRYQVRSRIARGGMATVYLATDLRLDRRVAVKVMHGHLADDSQFKQRFIQEARSAARLAHPNVVNVFDQGQDSDSAYLVMEYLPGITLRDLLDEYGSLTPQQTIDISEAVLNGLAAAHKAGIIHRDLKPENVLLADDGRIKIGDFGLARAASANTATGAQLLGTIAYLSPELVTRGVADTRSDIYAVGIMMYEMLTGEQPFTGAAPMQIAYRHANERVPAPSRRNAKIPPELDEIVLWATAKDPDQRPADARVLLEQVRDTEADLDLSDGPLPGRRTQVLPAARSHRPAPPAPPTVDAAAASGGAVSGTQETQVLEPRRVAATPGTGLDVRPDAAPRHRRRWIPLLAIVVALLLGAGIGWWFLFGPGSRITIPSTIAGMSVEQAREALDALGLEVAEQTGFTDDPTVPEGSVAQSDPPIGTAVAPGTSVTLLVSTGPAMIAIDLNQRMPQADAEAIVQEHWTAEPLDRRFDPDIPAGQLIDALDATGGSLLEATEYGELQPITLVISVGPLPDLAGRTLDQARALLDEVELDATAGAELFDNTIPAGNVIGIETTDGSGNPIVIRPGDTVVLTLSKGPDLVQLPDDLEDMTLADAKAALEALQFVVEVETNIPQPFWDFEASEVDTATPGPGEFAIRGSTVVLEAYA